MPDALSKSIPIWIAVLNRLIFPHIAECHTLQTPDAVVSYSEHCQIEERLSSFVSDITQLRLDINELHEKLRGKPLKPSWITPDSYLPEAHPELEDNNRVVLCTASGRTSSGNSVLEYVQGAADDSESWAHGLTPATFWAHSTDLQQTSEDNLPDVIESLVHESMGEVTVREPVLIKPTSNLWISHNAVAEEQGSKFKMIISCSEEANSDLALGMKERYLHLCCATGKVGSRQLRIQLSKLSAILHRLTTNSTILVCCPTSKDLAVGVALAILCLRYSANGAMEFPSQATESTRSFNKASIKQRLSWIMVSMPDASPSRATLQSVNAFLMG